MFKVGQKVICIDDAPMRNDCGDVMPLRLVHGQVYTIREIHTEPNIAGYGVRLDELLNPSIVWADIDEKEWSYQSERFRPVAGPREHALALSSTQEKCTCEFVSDDLGSPQIKICPTCSHTSTDKPGAA